MAAGWEQQITELLQEAQNIAVRFDVVQKLSETQQSTARNNIGVNATGTQLSDNDYMIVLEY